MNIGIIGTGNMGGALGARWAGHGHSVLFGSRDPGRAMTVARAAAGAASGNAQAGDFDEAAAFGEVVLYTVRGIFPSVLLRDPRMLAGKVIIDCNNTDLDRHMRPIRLDATGSGPTLAERLAADVPDARIVKAFSSVPHRVIELDRETLAPYRISVLLCGDDPAAKATVRGLAEELGFVGIDCGPLERSAVVDGATDFLRFQIGEMGLGPFAALSVNVVETGRRPAR
jgi:8-hydroxy-5-deazaflavin:NADPH oxidoreductase